MAHAMPGADVMRTLVALLALTDPQEGELDTVLSGLSRNDLVVMVAAMTGATRAALLLAHNGDMDAVVGFVQHLGIELAQQLERENP